MKKMVINIAATTGITLVVLSVVALCYNATLICISSVFQALFLNILIYIGLYVLEHFEYRYPVLETGSKLLYVMALVLVIGRMFGWYEYISVAVLCLMTIIIFSVCMCLDMVRLLDEVKEINGLLKQG